MEAWVRTLAGVDRAVVVVVVVVVAVRDTGHLDMPPSPAVVAVSSWNKHCWTLKKTGKNEYLMNKVIYLLIETLLSMHYQLLT